MGQLVPASPSLPRSSRPGVGAGKSTAGRLAWAHLSTSLPVHAVIATLATSLLFSPACSHSCSFESPAWEAVDASLCSLFRPLSPHWRQPCSSLGCLINSIINAKRKESPRSFLIATRAREYKWQADRKQGLVPGDAPLPASGALHLPMPSWTTWPHLLGQAWRAYERKAREEMARKHLSGDTHTRLISPILSNGCKLSLGGEMLALQL